MANKIVIKTLSSDEVKAIGTVNRTIVPDPASGKAYANVKLQYWKGIGSTPYVDENGHTPRFDVKCDDHSSVMFYDPDFLNGQTSQKEVPCSYNNITNPYTTTKLALTSTSSHINNGDFPITVVVIYDEVDIVPNP